MSIQHHLQEVRKSIENMKEYAISGDIQPHEALAEIKMFFIDDILKREIKEIQSASLEVLRSNFIEYGEKSYKSPDYTFTIRSGATKYTYTDIPEHKEKKKELEKTDKYRELKDVEQKYKAAYIQKQKGVAMFDEETGEEINVEKVKVTYSADSITIKKR